jgi:hypothetical protein
MRPLSQCSFIEHVVSLSTCKIDGEGDDKSRSDRRMRRTFTGIAYALLKDMLFLFAIVAVTSCAIAVVGYCLRKAPVGYEDEQGFHIVPQIRGSAVVRRRLRPTQAGSLKSARANS